MAHGKWQTPIVTDSRVRRQTGVGDCCRWVVWVHRSRKAVPSLGAALAVQTVLSDPASRLFQRQQPELTGRPSRSSKGSRGPCPNSEKWGTEPVDARGAPLRLRRVLCTCYTCCSLVGYCGRQSPTDQWIIIRRKKELRFEMPRSFYAEFVGNRLTFGADLCVTAGMDAETLSIVNPPTLIGICSGQ